MDQARLFECHRLYDMCGSQTVNYRLRGFNLVLMETNTAVYDSILCREPRTALLVFVRHPESTANEIIHKNRHHTSADELTAALNNHPTPTNGDPDITESVGQQQVRYTSAYLADKCLKGATAGETLKITRSDMLRTARLAESFRRSILTTSTPAMVIDPELQEYTRVGKSVPEHLRYRDEIPQTFISRVYKYYQRLADDNGSGIQNDITIVFGHSMFFSTLLSIMLLKRLQPEMTETEVVGALVEKYDPEQIKLQFQLPNCSITTVRASICKCKSLSTSSSNNGVTFDVLGVGNDSHVEPRTRGTVVFK